MKECKVLHIEGDVPFDVEFGRVEKEEELRSLYQLRYDVYHKRHYIKNNQEKIDFDEYDRKENTVLFGARINGEFIGTVRLIREERLPTEDAFHFEEPIQLFDIEKKARGEVSRLVIKKAPEPYVLPRHIVMLFLVACMTDFSVKNGMLGGYMFLKEGARAKLEKLGVPVHRISDFEVTYAKNGVLSKYFYDTDEAITPHYFITDEVNAYLNNILERKHIFEQNPKGVYHIRKSLYTKLLKFFGFV